MSRSLAHQLAHEITEAVADALSVGAKLEAIEPYIERRLVEVDEDAADCGDES